MILDPATMKEPVVLLLAIFHASVLADKKIVRFLPPV